MLKQENVNTMAEFDEYLAQDNLPMYSIDSNDLANLDLGLGTFNSQGNLVVLTPPDVSEDTLDVAYSAVPSSSGDSIPPSPIGRPSRTQFTGGLNFNVEINASDTHRKKYLYSHQLNRIYVDRKMNFPIQFRWDFDRGMTTMFVRATTVFSDESQAEKRVERCLQHTHESSNAGVHQAIVMNVLHSSREPGTQDVFYCGDPSVPDSWYSVLLRFHASTQGPYSHAYQFVCKNSCSSGINRRAIDIIFTLEDHTFHASTQGPYSHAYQFVCKNSCSSGINRRAIDIIFTLEDHTFHASTQGPYSHAYQFVCKNSCSSGINRRAIDIIFTLEDHTGMVYGRQIVGARVCACPKRDKLKDEEADPKPTKRRISPPAPPQPVGKKVKIEPDEDVLVLPPLPIVGRRTMITGLQVMQNMMEALAAKCDQDAADKYHTAIRSIRDKIDELNNPQE